MKYFLGPLSSCRSGKKYVVSSTWETGCLCGFLCFVGGGDAGDEFEDSDDGECDDVDCWDIGGGVIFFTVTSLWDSGEKEEKWIGVLVTEKIKTPVRTCKSNSIKSLKLILKRC